MLLLAALSGLLIVAFATGMAWAWWQVSRPPRRSRPRSRNGLDAQAALRRHPAGRARWGGLDGEPPNRREPGPASQGATGPDDDPEFISALERLIRGEGPDGAA